MRAKDIIGKRIIDVGGKEVGAAEDIHIDWRNRTIKALVLGGQGEIAQRLRERAELMASEETDVVIPFEDISVIGEVILSSKRLG